MPPIGEEGTDGSQDDNAGSEDPVDEVAALKDEVSTLKEMLTALMPSEEVADDIKDKDTKTKPHANTIKYAENLKKQMGKLYVVDWDKIPIDARISKMETFMEFKTQMESVNKGKGKKEGKTPKGKADDKDTKQKFKSFGGVNHKANAEAFKKFW